MELVREEPGYATAIHLSDGLFQVGPASLFETNCTMLFTVKLTAIYIPTD
jgi:hypothetical protein